MGFCAAVFGKAETLVEGDGAVLMEDLQAVGIFGLLRAPVCGRGGRPSPLSSPGMPGKENKKKRVRW